MLRIRSKPISFLIILTMVLMMFFGTGTIVFAESWHVEASGPSAAQMVADQNIDDLESQKVSVITTGETAPNHPKAGDLIVTLVAVYVDPTTSRISIDWEANKNIEYVFVKGNAAGNLDNEKSFLYHNADGSKTGTDFTVIPENTNLGIQHVSFYVGGTTPLVPELSIEKTADVTQAAIGDLVNYTIVITNTGETTLTSISVTDPALSVLNGSIVDPLAPGASFTMTGSATLAAVPFTNTAIADSAETDPEEDSVTIEEKPIPQYGLTLTKSALQAYATTGATIEYSFTLKNTGDTALTGVTLSDTRITTWGGIVPGTLAVGATAEVTGVAIATEFPYINVASASAVEVRPVTDTATVNLQPAEPRYAATLTKVANRTTAITGDAIEYTITITNTGNRDLTGVHLDDPMLTLADVPNKINTGQQVTVTGTATATYFPWINIATLEASNISDLTATAIVTLTPPEPTYALNITKVADKSLANPGETISYTLTITNVGTGTLTNLAVNDPKIPTLSGIIPESLAAGASFTMTGSAVMGQETIVNTATADSEQSEPDTDTWTVALRPAYGISITKTPSPTSMTEPGGTFVYTFVVYNTGNQPVQLTAVYDNVLGTITLPSQTVIAAGASSAAMTASAIHTAIGNYTNNVLATAQSIETQSTVYVTASATATVSVTSAGGGGGGGGGGDEETTTITPEPTPLAPITPTEEPVVLVEEETPLAALPQTGETDPLIFLGLGALLAFAGYRLRKEAEEK